MLLQRVPYPLLGHQLPGMVARERGKKRRKRKHNKIINNPVGWKRVGEEDGLTEGEGVASAFEVAGE